MQWRIEKGSLVLIPNNADLEDINFIKLIEPYPSSTYSNEYRAPLTLSLLWTFVKYFNINWKDNELLSSKINSLSLLMNFNSTDPIIETKQLRPYQYLGVDWAKIRLKKDKGVGLLWAPRTGKTRTACLISENYKKIIVLSLAGQEANWDNTYNEIVNRKCLNIHKKQPKSRVEIYEEFNNSNEPTILIGSMNTITNDVLENRFALKDFDLLIIDEIHKLKNHKTSLRKGAMKLRKRAEYCVGLTGTPVSKHSNEMLPLFTLIVPDYFSKTYLSNYFFEQEYTRFSDYGTAGSLKKSKELEWLDLMGLYFSQVNKNQALVWADKPEEFVVKLKMGEEQDNVYKTCLLDKELHRENGDVEQIQDNVAQLTRLRQILTHPQLLNINAPSIKEEWVLKYLEDNRNDNGIIIFSTQTKYLNMLYSKICNLYRVCLITGKEKDKTKIAQKFQNGEYDIVLANIQAGSKGITLDKADTMIFLDEDWRPDENLQAVERFTATTKNSIKSRKIYRLETSNTYTISMKEEVPTLDVYTHQVVEGKISNTEIITKFEELYKLNFRKN